jgi:predicted Zn-dependent protease
LRRLAQIEIARGDYAEAKLNLERAYHAAPDQRAIRQMLGELYALEGQLDAATSLWQNIIAARQLLENRVWWYDYIGDPHAANNLRAVLQRLGN